MSSETQVLTYEPQAVPAKVSLSLARQILAVVVGVAVTAAIAVAGTVVVTFALLAAVVLAPVGALVAAGVLVRHGRRSQRVLA